MGDSKEQDSSIERSGEPKSDLNNLLDSALDDFDKPLPKLPVQALGVAPVEDPGNKFSKLDSNDSGTKEFKQFQDAMQSFMKQDPNVKAQLDQLTASDSSVDFSTSLEEAMKSIVDGAQSIPEPSADDLAQLFNDLGISHGPEFNNAEVPEFMPFMKNVMQNLLSKDVLYPAINDIVGKYPDWLAENRSKLESKVYENYSRQYDLMKQICEEFEKDHELSEDARSQSFEKILALMQKMQECGNPPKGIIGDLAPDLPFDEEGNVKMGGMPEQCAIM